MTKLKDNEYQCGSCGGIFIKGVSDEAALKEKEEIFPDTPIEECSLVCDDCWNILTAKEE